MEDDVIEQLVYQPDSSPFNVAFPIWTARWWRWLHSFPKDKSPALDLTGEACCVSQYDPKVWFLVGTFGGVAVRRCIIPSSKAILFPIITTAFSFAVDPHLKSEEELTLNAVKDIDTVKKLNLTLDAFNFSNLARFRVRSKAFDDVIYGQPTRAVSDGYWILIKGLQKGSHTIHFIGENVDFFNEVTYNITISK